MSAPFEEEILRLLIPSVVVGFRVRIYAFADSVDFQIAQNSANVPRILFKVASLANKLGSGISGKFYLCVGGIYRV